MFPRMTSKSAPVALGTLLVLPWKVSSINYLGLSDLSSGLIGINSKSIWSGYHEQK
ncbi:hypothetical protein [Peribacillus sp. NPDC096448]|uniref:hypothetical protein n=1 Tax=Peribacillus sp. NPDC096448 TaxID=3364395 RepID=UPI0037F3BEE5